MSENPGTPRLGRGQEDHGADRTDFRAAELKGEVNREGAQPSGASGTSEAASWRGISYLPAWWLPGGHAQTVGGRLLRRSDRRPLLQERVELPDGDFVDLHTEPTGELPADAPVVVVLHGLEGWSRSNYVATLARELTARGMRVVRLNFRACSGEMNRLARFYHAGDTGDLDHVVRLLRRRYPASPLGAAGFSLGGNVLLKYLGELGASGDERIAGAVAVSVPFDLRAGAARLEQGLMSRIYTRYFIHKLRSKAARKRDLLVGRCDLEGALRASSIRAYDEALTARIHGFASATEYYEKSSSAGWISRIRTATLVLHALDDPFLPTEAVPLQEIRDNPWILDGMTERGGHVGFIGGSPWSPSFWAEAEAARFLSERLGAAATADRLRLNSKDNR